MLLFYFYISTDDFQRNTYCACLRFSSCTFFTFYTLSTFSLLFAVAVICHTGFYPSSVSVNNIVVIADSCFCNKQISNVWDKKEVFLFYIAFRSVSLEYDLHTVCITVLHF